MSRVGVFVCHCGENIGGTVDCARVAEAAAKLPGVVHAVDYKYMCSDPGQNLIQQAVREKQPRRRRGGGLLAAHARADLPAGAAEAAGLNPYLCEMANLREHCSWVHEKAESHDREGDRPRADPWSRR